MKLKGRTVVAAALASLLAAPASQAQTTPPVLGTYTGSGTLTQTSCRDPGRNGSVAVTATVIFTSGSGSAVAGNSTLTATIGGLGAIATATLTATISAQGALSGSFTYTAALAGLSPSQGSGTFTASASGNTVTLQLARAPGSDSCEVRGSLAVVDVTRAPDHDGDGRADAAIHERASGNWFVGRSTGASFTPTLWVTGFGNRGPDAEEAFAADFTGDGRTDLAVHARATGDWFIGRSTGTSFTVEQWATGFGTGGSAEESLAGDFTGDGRVDAAIRNRFTGDWFVGRSTGSSFAITQWAARFGDLGDAEEAFVGDFTGDGRADVAIHNRQSGDWFVGRSTGDSFTIEAWVSRFGNLGDVEEIFVGDFTGDGKVDIAIHNRQTGEWFIGRSTGGSFTVELWAVGFGNRGVPREEAFVADFTGDGRADAAIHDRVTGDWFVGRSTGSSFGVEGWVTGFGNMGDAEEVLAGQVR